MYKYFGIGGVIIFIAVLFAMPSLLSGQEATEFRPVPDHGPVEEEPIPIEYPIDPPPTTGGETIYLAGEKTRGILLEVNQSFSVQLPQDVQLGGRIRADLCWPGKECLKTPAWVIESGRGDIILLDRDLRLFELVEEGDPLFDGYRTQFQWLAEAVSRHVGAPAIWVPRKDSKGELESLKESLNDK